MPPSSPSDGSALQRDPAPARGGEGRSGEALGGEGRADERAPAVRIEGLRHGYDGGPDVLDIPSAVVPEGGRWLLLGRSGSGKSTLLHILGGLLRPRAGRVVVDGEDVTAAPAGTLDRWRGRTVGVVFQRLHLFETLSAADNLRAARWLAGLPPDEPRVRTLLDRLDLGPFGGAYPAALSTGQRQRVAIARALACRPRVVLADEPTASLDDARAAAVADLFVREAEASGAALVVATHDARIRGHFRDVLTLDPPGPGTRDAAVLASPMQEAAP